MSTRRVKELTATKPPAIQKPITVNALLKKLRAENLDQPSLVKEGILDVAISLTSSIVIVYTKDGEQHVEREQLIKMATPPEEVLLYDLGSKKILYSALGLRSAEFHDYTTPDVIRTTIRRETDHLKDGEYVKIHHLLAQQYLKHCTDLDIRTARLRLHGADPDSDGTLEDLMFGCNTSPQFTYTIAVKDGEGFRVEFWKRHLPHGAR